MNDVLRIINSRRSVRKYKTAPIEAVITEKILDAGRMAPSAVNKQPWKFYFLTKAELIRAIDNQIAEVAAQHLHLAHGKNILDSPQPIFHGAPLVVFITAPLDNEWAQLDIGMCVQNMMLAAKSLGLDSCPVGLGKFIEKTKFYSKLHIPATEHVVLAVIFGFGDEKPEMKERKKDNAFYIPPELVTDN